MRRTILTVLSSTLLPLLVCAQPAEWQDFTERITNPSFETGDLTGWICGEITNGDIGIRENANDIYTAKGCDGAWMFNTWYYANDYTFVAPNQYVEQTVKDLPKGEYRLVALAASDTYASVNTPVEFYANDAVLSFVPPHKTTFTEYELPFFVSPYTLNVKFGMRSASWFKCDHFRLYYLGETDDYRNAMGEGEGQTIRRGALVEYFDGYSTDGWTFTETAPHTHGDFPVVTNNMDKTVFEASKFQYWTGPNYQLGNARITYSYTGLTPGWYEFSSQVRIYDENSDFDGTVSGLTMLCADATTPIIDGREIVEGSLPGKGFIGKYRVMGQVGSDGTLTIGFETKNASFNWLSWTAARLLYYGSEQPVENHYFEQLENMQSIAAQSTDPSSFTPVYTQAVTDLNNAHSSTEAEAVLQTVRTAVLQLVTSTPATSGLYDLTPLIINPDLNEGAHGWTAVNANFRCTDTGIGTVQDTRQKASIHQLLTDMPAGHYTVMAQGFYRTAEPQEQMHRYEQGGEELKASLSAGGQSTLLCSIMDGRRYDTQRLSGMYAAIDGRGIPSSVVAVPASFDMGDYWNILDVNLTAEGPLDIGIDIDASGLDGNWTAFSHFRLLYGDTVADVQLTEDDTDFSVTQPLRAHVTLQKSIKAGVLTPLCVPFDLDAEQFQSLYAVGSCDGKTAFIYPVSRVKAGEPCVVSVASDVESIDFGTVLLSPVASDRKLLPWGGGELVRCYIKEARRELNYSWKYRPLSKETLTLASALTFQPMDPMHMDFSANLENYSARRFLSENTYTATNSSKIASYYQTSPPIRRDIPNPVVVPVGVESSDVYVEYALTSDFADAQRRSVFPGDNAYIPNLIPQRSYYYRVVADGEVVSRGHFHTDGRLRMIYAPSANNIRDLGGWPTNDGSKRVAYGKLFRGSELNGAHVATDYDLQVLRDLGIDAEIDLRLNSSYDNDGAGISAFHYTDNYYFAAGNDWLAEDFEKAESQRHWREEFQFVLETLRRGKALYFHCVWGADRTGLFALLCEGLLGLGYDSYFKDYELTSYSLAGLREKTSWADRLEYIAGLEGGSLREKFDNYFINKLQISKEDIEYFRSVMLVDVAQTDEMVDERVDYLCRQDGKANATVVCTLQPGVRNAVVFPFALNSTLLRNAFGAGSTMESISEYDGVELTTKKIFSTTAHVPFLLTPATVNDDNTYQFSGVTLVRGGARSASFTGGCLYGVYEAETDLAAEAKADATTTSYAMQDAHFYKATTDTPKLRGLHAYIVLDTPEPSAARNEVYFLGETPADAIQEVYQPETCTTDCYDLQGRRVATPQRGLYIVGGKKILLR